MTLYERIRQEHWLRDKQDEGKGLILNDDSVWEVDARNQFLTKSGYVDRQLSLSTPNSRATHIYFGTAQKGKLRELTNLGIFAPLARPTCPKCANDRQAKRSEFIGERFASVGLDRLVPMQLLKFATPSGVFSTFEPR